MSKELIDIALIKVGETDRAIKVTDGIKDALGERKEVWLPKSQIEIEKQHDGTIIVTMPEWLAKDKELV